MASSHVAALRRTESGQKKSTGSLRLTQPVTEQYVSELSFYLNGRRITLKSGAFDPQSNLLQYLRSNRLCGAKPGCGEGGCGACTVMVSARDSTASDGKVRHWSVNSCLLPLGHLADVAITTIEGVGDTSAMHAVQQRVASMHGSQCGYCTPGVVMSIFTQLQSNPVSTPEQLESSLHGNLCRCTGYRPIVDAATSFATGVKDANDSTLGASDSAVASENTSSSTTEQKRSDGHSGDVRVTSPIPFPLVLQHKAPAPMRLQSPSELETHSNSETTWYSPLTIQGMLELTHIHPHAMVLGITGHVGQLHSQYRTHTDVVDGGCDVIIAPERIPSLQQYTVADVNETEVVRVGGAGGTGSEPTQHLVLGACLSLQRLNDYLKERSQGESIPTSVMAMLSSIVNQYGASQRRATSTIGALALSGYADVAPALIALGAVLNVGCLQINEGQGSGSDGHWCSDIDHRKILLEDYLSGKTQIDPGQVVLSLNLPLVTSTPDCVTVQSSTSAVQRQANTRGVLTLAASGMLSRKEASGPFKWTSCKIVVGCAVQGRGPIVCSLTAAEIMKGSFDTPTVSNMGGMQTVFDLLLKELSIDDAQWGGKAHFKRTLAMSLLKEYLEHVTRAVAESSGHDIQGTASTITNAMRGVQVWETPNGGLTSARPTPLAPITDASVDRSPVGEPLMHSAAKQQATGQAVFVDDMPSPDGCLYAALVTSQRAHARVVAIDPAPALEIEGVHAYYDQYDLAERESKKAVDNIKEKVFATGTVTAIGHCIGVVVADDWETAQRAARLVAVTYEDLPVITSIEEAIAAESFYPYDRKIEEGDVDAALEACQSAGRVVSGSMAVGAQEHLYMEPHALLVVPGEDDEMHVYSCTQCLMKTQRTVAGCLGVPAHKVQVHVKRIGGGFGGKEVLTTFTAARLAVASRRLRRPIRWRLTRSTDIATSGQRHPFFVKYRVGYDVSGKIIGADIDMYANGGNTESITKEVMSRALFHAFNAYDFPNVRVRGRCCYTNISSNTAYRGFGIPQAVVVCETYMEQVADALGVDGDQIRALNMVREGGRTHYGQLIEYCRLGRLWSRIHSDASIAARKEAVSAFNKSSTIVKRGIAVTPVMYGIAFPCTFLNQSGALVVVYADGSVLLSHGGTEMGQGLNVKMIQVAAQALGCPVESVHISEAGTDKVPNTPPTAASVGADLNGMAVLDACQKITERLAPVRADMPGVGFKELATEAWKRCISLSATGHFIADKCGVFDFGTHGIENARRGTMWKYFAYGASCCEVEIDTVTGASKVLRADLLMDVGKSLNAAIDIGQVEGGFVQGVGMYTCEEMQWGDDQHTWAPRGQCLSTSIAQSNEAYLIPTVADAPRDLRVTLLPDAPNPFAVHSSKAVGEPPLILSVSAFVALRRAVAAARATASISSQVGARQFRLDSPATSERIRMAIGDDCVIKSGACKDFVPPVSC